MVTAYPQAIARDKTEIDLISTSPYVKDYTEERKKALIALLPQGDVKVLKFNQSLCPGCVDEEKWDTMKIDCIVYVKDNKVWMTKQCGMHGVVTEVYWSDYDMYKKTYKISDKFNVLMAKIGRMWLSEIQKTQGQFKVKAEHA